MDNVISTVVAAVWSFWGLLAYGALIFTISSVNVWRGLRSLDRTEAIPISSSSREQWLAEFTQWNAVAPSALEDERERLLQQRAVVESYQTLGEGLSGLLSGSILMGFALVIRGVIAAPSSAGFLLYFSALQIALATMYESGRFLGYRAGALRISRGRAHSQNGEVRALGDYVAPWVWLVPIAAPACIFLMFMYIVVTTGITAIASSLVVASILSAGLLLVATLLALLRALWRLDLPDIFSIGDQERIQRANMGAVASAIGDGMVRLWWASMFTLMGVILGPGSDVLDNSGFGLGQALFFTLVLGTFALFLCLYFVKDKIAKGKTGRLRPQAPISLAPAQPQ